jgi:hypothetical protein
MQCLDTLIAYEIDKDQNSRDEYIAPDEPVVVLIIAFLLDNLAFLNFPYAPP